MKTLTSGCENVPAWRTWMTYPICWGHSWWSYSYPLVFYGIRPTQEPACRHSVISWSRLIEQYCFSFKQPDIQMSTDKLGLFNSVWPSDAFNLPWGNQTLHSWQETVFHDFASVCVCLPCFPTKPLGGIKNWVPQFVPTSLLVLLLKSIIGFSVLTSWPGSCVDRWNLPQSNSRERGTYYKSGLIGGFNPPWKILVSWDDYSQYMGK